VRKGAGLDLGGDWNTVPRPRIAFVKTPLWDNASEIAKDAFMRLNQQWGEMVCEVELPGIFESAVQWHRTIMESDLANNYENLYADGKNRLSDTLREMIERGQQHKAMDYSKAQEGVVALNRELDKIFSGCDAILTPATSAEAPMGLAFTGSPMFCTIWTLCGVPAISLPILEGQDRMPMGAQLVANKGGDAGLLRLARWLTNRTPQVLNG
jgi:Asp-tRNA(Asn)/Glu-tRNA(Gln) amidotransferase A subunit family amidase